MRRTGHSRSSRRTVMLAAAAVLAVPAAAVPTAVGAASPSASSTATADLPSGNTAYRTLADYEADLAELVADHPDLVKPITLPYPTTSGRTVRGVEISTNVNADDGKPTFVDVGMHHGNEFPSGELTMEFAIDLVQRAAAGDRSVTRLLDRARVVVVPIVNVDGFVRGRRQTDTNTDMNRNYGLGWLPISTGGAAAWSEPETRNIEWLLSTRQATVFNTQHTCIQVVLYPPLQLAAGPAQDVDRLHALASEVASIYGPGYKALPSAEDYETTGEAIDWAYYATRGLALTTETCPDAGVARTYETQVLDVYDEHRDAMTTMLATAADPAQYAVIDGKGPKGAVLRITKAFDMYTSPYAQPDGATRPSSFTTTLTSDLTLGRNGKFEWAVNPSYRPIPAYQEDGIHGFQTGFYEEPWILTCERPDGTVLQTVPVNVDLGETVTVDLKQCRRDFHRSRP
ncbi:M14 family zinc carboxypeptidase [Jiangella sp. DSM 45060]|uniref:M14 family zinc carboxypeptidase n=1 Tax=Jiangella sp. DSM 45060 TaxID=1798224 RepID=UPI000879C55D|nr:M14 family zinc carboxypeptidase [Jiangella sp. DSM 45060]SDT72157.1 Zinc carboxypeptidase [Jiangella sp. DSM 45060]